MDNSMNENKKLRTFKIINWKSIAIGSVIPLIGYIVVINGSIAFFDSPEPELYSVALFFALLLLSPVLGGFVAAYMNKPVYLVGVINGTLAVFTGLIIFGLLNFYYYFNDFYMLGDELYLDIAFFVISSMFYIVPILLLGFFGAFSGTSVKKAKQGKLFLE